MCARFSCEILATGENEVSSLQVTLDEPLSPELALVCPELAERARTLLPDPGWLAPVVRVDPPQVGVLQAFAIAVASIAVTATPLALVVLARPEFQP
jgi:hypothetical protein